MQSQPLLLSSCILPKLGPKLLNSKPQDQTLFGFSATPSLLKKVNIKYPSWQEGQGVQRNVDGKKNKNKLSDNLKLNILSHKHLVSAISLSGTPLGIFVSILSFKHKTLSPCYRGRNRLRWPTTPSEPPGADALCLRQVYRPQDWLWAHSYAGW